MSTKKVKYNKQGIEKLPNDKPVLYRIETESGRMNYVGVAQRGRVQERLSEHLEKIPGATVRIEQFNSISDAQRKEVNVIRRTQAKYNKQGKWALWATGGKCIGRIEMRRAVPALSLTKDSE